MIKPAKEMRQQMEARNEEVGRKCNTIKCAKGYQAPQDGGGEERGSLLFIFSSRFSRSWASDILYYPGAAGA